MVRSSTESLLFRIRDKRLPNLHSLFRNKSKFSEASSLPDRASHLVLWAKESNLQELPMTISND